MQNFQKFLHHYSDYFFKKSFKHLVLHVTNHCNFRCAHCFVDFTNPPKDLKLEDYKKISENINDLLDTLANYSKHVKSVYGLESFYGDQVLHKLLKHSQEIVEQIETFDEILYLTEEEGELMNEQEEQYDQYDTDSTDSREDTKEAPPNPKRIRGSF